jgi:hypothetical protein
MDWGKVTYIFLTLMSLTTTAGFLYEPNIIALFIAGGVNVISTILKIGVKNLLAAELLAFSPFNKYGVTFPLEDKHVLNATEEAEVTTATAKFNSIISSLASSKGLAFVDANTKMKELSQNSGIQFDGVKYTAKFVTGGAFSLDGVHLTGRGYAIIANEFIKDNSSANHGFNIAMMSDIKSQTPDDIFMDVLQNSLKSCSFLAS